MQYLIRNDKEFKGSVDLQIQDDKCVMKKIYTPLVILYNIITFLQHFHTSALIGITQFVAGRTFISKPKTLIKTNKLTLGLELCPFDPEN